MGYNTDRSRAFVKVPFKVILKNNQRSKSGNREGVVVLAFIEGSPKIIAIQSKTIGRDVERKR